MYLIKTSAGLHHQQDRNSSDDSAALSLIQNDTIPDFVLLSDDITPAASVKLK